MSVLFLRRVNLDQWKLVAQGASRAVFENRSYPDILIKTVKPTAQTVGGNRKIKHKYFFLRKWRRFGAYMSFRREVEEYLNLARRFVGEQPDLPIAKIHGFIETSRGLGMVVEKVAARDGSLAPTLSRLILDGRFEQKHLDALNEFFREASRLHVILMDANLGNFVWAEHRGAKPLVICVDGTGEKTALKLYSMSNILNRWRLWRYKKRLHAEMRKRANAAGVDLPSLTDT